MKFLRRFRKKEPDENSISWIAGEDQKMQAAIEKAQASYQVFFQAITKDMKRIVPVITDSLVKYAFPVENGPTKVEHMYLSDFELEDDMLYGYLASEPQFTRKVKEGDRIEVKQNQISDWLFVTADETHGGHTFLVMWDGFSNQEKDIYKEHPPFCWLYKKMA